MSVTHQVNQEQSRLWNGRAGEAWADAQESLDRVFKPFETLLVDEVVARGAKTVLDVGCGAGGTTLAVARQLESTGRAIGVDISEALISVAAARAERERTRVDFICADAQTHAFVPRSVDMIISRFGVMFFDDPVAAFANLRRAARHDAELRCIVFRSPADNPFMTTAERAAAPLLPNLPTRRLEGPGQFAFADPKRVASILGQAGWARIDIRPLDVECRLPENELVRYLTRLGPLGMMLQDVDDATRAHVVAVVRAAFDGYVDGADVRFTAACWMAGARVR